jgi:hypothetical protein
MSRPATPTRKTSDRLHFTHLKDSTQEENVSSCGASDIGHAPHCGHFTSTCSGDKFRIFIDNSAHASRFLSELAGQSWLMPSLSACMGQRVTGSLSAAKSMDDGKNRKDPGLPTQSLGIEVNVLSRLVRYH